MTASWTCRLFNSIAAIRPPHHNFGLSGGGGHHLFLSKLLCQQGDGERADIRLDEVAWP